jgi:hypothetical protein
VPLCYFDLCLCTPWVFCGFLLLSKYFCYTFLISLNKTLQCIPICCCSCHVQALECRSYMLSTSSCCQSCKPKHTHTPILYRFNMTFFSLHTQSDLQDRNPLFEGTGVRVVICPSNTKAWILELQS